MFKALTESTRNLEKVQDRMEHCQGPLWDLIATWLRSKMGLQNPLARVYMTLPNEAASGKINFVEEHIAFPRDFEAFHAP